MTHLVPTDTSNDQPPNGAIMVDENIPMGVDGFPQMPDIQLALKANADLEKRLQAVRYAVITDNRDAELLTNPAKVNTVRQFLRSVSLVNLFKQKCHEDVTAYNQQLASYPGKFFPRWFHLAPQPDVTQPGEKAHS